MSVLLASGSPQRSAILTQLRIPFRVHVPNVDEVETGDPYKIAERNSRAKAEAARGMASTDELVLAVDTVVELDGAIYGKPGDDNEARATLQTLRARTHRVVSGLTLIVDDDVHTISETTAVTFRDFGDDELDQYLATGEWAGRAGGYAIQGAGAGLVKEVTGDFQNVVGLPVAALLELLIRTNSRNRAYSHPG